MGTGGLKKQNQESIFSQVWLSDSQALDLCTHGHVSVRKAFFGVVVYVPEVLCVKWGLICTRSPIVWRTKPFYDLAVP